MTQRKRETGSLGEQMACELLVQRGMDIVERGWRCPRGEIDIVARDGETWAFVEVKTRHGHRAGLPEEAMNPAKIARVGELAEIYMGEHALGNVTWRIDLVALELDTNDRVLRANLVTGITLQ